MKLLFVHLSDAHFTSEDQYMRKYIDAQVQSLNLIADFDKCCIIFSGDLAFSGKRNEYKQCRKYLGGLWRGIKDKFPKDERIETFIVPGNHDIDFNGAKRSRVEINELFADGVTDDILQHELMLFENFYELADYYHCFQNNKLIDIKTFKLGNKKIQINLINTELFSTCGDEYGDDDKGKHYMPIYEWNKLSRGKDVNLVVTVAHHGPEWFNWEAANKFREELYNSSDIFLYGHEHITDISQICSKDEYVLKSIANGIDFKKSNMVYTTLLIDFEAQTATATVFKWDETNSLFVRSEIGTHELTQNRTGLYLIRPSSEYLKSISFDDRKQELKKYFVFPGIEILGGKQVQEIKDFNEFMLFVDDKEQVIIEADDASGKTTLLHYIYRSLAGNYVPLYLNEEGLVSKNPEKAIKFAFQFQYGDSDVAYEKFLQLDKSKKVVLLDDMSKIKPRFIKPLEEYLVKNFGRIISVVEPKWDIDIIDLIKTEFDDTKKVARTRLLPFYTTKRLELIKNIIYINNEDIANVEKEAQKINSFIRDQIKLFTLSPKFINMYVDCYIRDVALATETNKNVFGRVFENSIINSIRRVVSESDVEEYTVLLEEVAYRIHFEEKYPLAATELSKIIDEFNNAHFLKISQQKFCEAMIASKILVEEDNAYLFYNNNFLAYFVAKSLNTRYNNDEGAGELEQIAQNICFNINGDILLFLSYITSNMKILRFIREQAEEHMKDWTEFNMDEKNLGFIFKTACPEIKNLPSQEDRKKREEREEQYEKAASQKDKIEKIGLYEYNKADIETEDYKLVQAIQFTSLVCKMLPGFNHRLKKEEKEAIANDIFLFPNKIIFKEMRWIDEQFDAITTIITDIYKDREEITEEIVKQAIIRAAETYILNVYDIFARESVTDKTIDIMNIFEPQSTNHRIQHIMMLENLGRFKAFTNEANKLYDSTDLSVVKSMITRIIYKHFLYNKNLKMVGDVESVAKKYFGQSFKKTDLLK